MSDRDDTLRPHREPHRPYDPAKAAQRRATWLRAAPPARDDNRIAKGRRADNIGVSWHH